MSPLLSLSGIRELLQKLEEGRIAPTLEEGLLLSLFAPAHLRRLLRVPADLSFLTEHKEHIRAIRDACTSNSPLASLLSKHISGRGSNSSLAMDRLRTALILALVAVERAEARKEGELWEAIAPRAPEDDAFLQALESDFAPSHPGRTTRIRIIVTQEHIAKEDRESGGRNARITEAGRIGWLYLESVPGRLPLEVIPHPDVYLLCRDAHFERSLQRAVEQAQELCQRNPQIPATGQLRWNVRLDDGGANILNLAGPSMSLAFLLGILMALDPDLPSHSDIVVTGEVGTEKNNVIPVFPVESEAVKLDTAFSENTFPVVYGAIIGGETFRSYPYDPRLRFNPMVYEVPDIQTALDVLRRAERLRRAVCQKARADFAAMPIIVSREQKVMASVFVAPTVREEVATTRADSQHNKPDASSNPGKIPGGRNHLLTTWEEPGVRFDSVSPDVPWEVLLKRLHPDEAETGMYNRESAAPRLAVLAPPGGGKSVLLRRIASALAESPAGADVPGYVYLPALMEFQRQRLRAIGGRDAEFDPQVGREILAPYLAIRTGGSVPAVTQDQQDWIKQWSIWLQDGRVTLLFDGWDEIPHDHPYIAALISSYPRCPILLACRTAARESLETLRFNGASSGFATFLLSPLSYQSQDELIYGYFGVSPHSTPDESPMIQEQRVLCNHLLEELDRKPQIERLARNPMLLSLICFFLEENVGSHLPETRTQLYLQIVQHMLTRLEDTVADRQGSPQRRHTRQELRWRLLEALALELERGVQDGHTLWLRRPEVHQLFSQEIQRALPAEPDPGRLAGEIMEEFRTHFRLLNAFRQQDDFPADSASQSPLVEEDAFRLIHRTFEEFFAASALARRTARFGIASLWEVLDSLYVLPHYREVMAFLSGLLADQEQGDALVALVQRQNNLHSEDFLGHGLWMTGWCLGQVPEEYLSRSLPLQRACQVTLERHLDYLVHWSILKVEDLLEHPGEWFLDETESGNATLEIASRLLDMPLHTLSPMLSQSLISIGMNSKLEIPPYILALPLHTLSPMLSQSLSSIDMNPKSKNENATVRDLILYYLHRLCSSFYVIEPRLLAVPQKAFRREYYHKGRTGFRWFMDSLQAEFLLSLLSSLGSHPLWNDIREVVKANISHNHWNYMLDMLLRLGLRFANRTEAESWQKLIAALHEQQVFGRSMCAVHALNELSPRLRGSIIDVEEAIERLVREENFWNSEPEASSVWPKVPASLFQLKTILDARLPLTHGQCKRLADFLKAPGLRRLDQAVHILYMLTGYEEHRGLLRQYSLENLAWRWFYELRSHSEQGVAFFCGHCAACLIRLDPSNRTGQILKHFFADLAQGKRGILSPLAGEAVLQHMGELWDKPTIKNLRVLFDEFLPHLRDNEDITSLDHLTKILVQLLPHMDTESIQYCREEILQRTTDAIDRIMMSDDKIYLESEFETSQNTLELLKERGIDTLSSSPELVQEEADIADFRVQLANLLSISGYSLPEDLDKEREKIFLQSIVTAVRSAETSSIRDYRRHLKVAKFGLAVLEGGGELFVVADTIRTVLGWIDSYSYTRLNGRLSWNPLAYVASLSRSALSPQIVSLLRDRLASDSVEQGDIATRRTFSIALSGTRGTFMLPEVRGVIEAECNKYQPKSLFRAQLSQHRDAFQSSVWRGVGSLLTTWRKMLPWHIHGHAQRAAVSIFNLWPLASRDHFRIRRSDHQLILVAELEKHAQKSWQNLPHLPSIR